MQAFLDSHGGMCCGAVCSRRCNHPAYILLRRSGTRCKEGFGCATMTAQSSQPGC
jgi:hypothetical protein